jgi:hypothetical protein
MIGKSIPNRIFMKAPYSFFAGFGVEIGGSDLT